MAAPLSRSTAAGAVATVCLVPETALPAAQMIAGLLAFNLIT